MSDPMYEKKPGSWPDPQNETSYPANLPYSESDPLTEPVQSSAIGYGAPPPAPPQYEAYYGPAGGGSYQNPDAQAPQAIFIAPVQTCNEPDHIGYSVFTMICCFLPLGIAALIYTIKTREANLTGNATSARHYSRMALIFGHAAVGVGIVIITLYIILMIHFNSKASQMGFDGS